MCHFRGERAEFLKVMCNKHIIHYFEKMKLDIYVYTRNQRSALPLRVTEHWMFCSRAILEGFRLKLY